MAKPAPVKPLGDHVLVKRAEAAEVSKGGIVLPETAKDKPQEGKVLATGNGKVLDNGERSSFSVKAGDRVIFNSYGGTEVKHNGEEFLIMTENDIPNGRRILRPFFHAHRLGLALHNSLSIATRRLPLRLSKTTREIIPITKTTMQSNIGHTTISAAQ